MPGVLPAVSNYKRKKYNQTGDVLEPIFQTSPVFHIASLILLQIQIQLLNATILAKDCLQHLL